MTTQTMSHRRYIVLESKDGIWGHWGRGATLDEARENLRRAARRPGKARPADREYEFASDLPFAPGDREATDDEADAWIGQDGSLNWIRCQLRQLK
jgi:hypothetical protein